MLRLTLFGVACPDRPDISTHEDMLRPASLKQLDAEKMDSLRSNQESMKSSGVSVSAISESAFAPRPLDESEATAVSDKDDTFTASLIASLSPKLIHKPRQTTNALRPEEIGNCHMRLHHSCFGRMSLAYK